MRERQEYQGQKRRCDDRSRDQRSVAMNSGMWVASRRWKRQGTDSLLENPERILGVICT